MAKEQKRLGPLASQFVGSGVLGIAKYYDTYLPKLDAKFGRWPLEQHNTAVCPVHEDNDPSMGVIQGRSGEEKYHCFGCGSAGTVVELHLRVVRKWEKRSINENGAVKELCALVGWDFEEFSKKHGFISGEAGFDSAEDNSIRGRYLRRTKRVLQRSVEYSISEFTEEVRACSEPRQLEESLALLTILNKES